MRLGIDVGGTNTDAVPVEGGRVRAEIKVATTEDVTSGIPAALAAIRTNSTIEPAEVRSVVVVGTTHVVNAIVEADRLAPTAVVRLGLPATAALPPMFDWPESLLAATQGTAVLCHGGFEFDGRTIARLDRDELLRVVDLIGEAGIRSVAITGVFSPVIADQEIEVAALLEEHHPDPHVSMSHEIGRIGLLERENAAAMNACLRDLADQVCARPAETVAAAGFSAALHLSQNDGTLMDVDTARRFPVATFASGPTNSMRGAAFLTGLSGCAVVDVGGTTTDVGVLAGGLPRETPSDGSSRRGSQQLSDARCAVDRARGWPPGGPRSATGAWWPTWTESWSGSRSTGWLASPRTRWTGCGPALHRCRWSLSVVARSCCPPTWTARAGCTGRTMPGSPTRSARRSPRSAVSWTGSCRSRPVGGTQRWTGDVTPRPQSRQDTRPVESHGRVAR